jgi:alpha-glucosidase
MAFIREYGESRLLAVFNFSPAEAGYDLPLLAHAEVLSGHGFPSGTHTSGRVTIPACAAFFAKLP